MYQFFEQNVQPVIAMKVGNTQIKRQDLRRGVVDSKMLLFYRSQIGQCSVATCIINVFIRNSTQLLL